MSAKQKKAGFISVSALNLKGYEVLFEIYDQNLAWQRYVGGTKRISQSS